MYNTHTLSTKCSAIVRQSRLSTITTITRPHLIHCERPACYSLRLPCRSIHNHIKSTSDLTSTTPSSHINLSILHCFSPELIFIQHSLPSSILTMS